MLTLWTSDGAMELANPAAHTHADFQPASSLSGEVDSRYYVIEPDSEDEYASPLVLAGGDCSLYCVLKVHFFIFPRPPSLGMMSG
jgi:hypothetical protein